MAIKNRSTLVNDSDATFLDNTSGQIIPENHREFNDDVIDSAAMVGDTNTFLENNTFNRTTLVKNLQLYKDALEWDASNVAPIGLNDGANNGIQGNYFTIINDGTIPGVQGLAGSIYYALHTGNVLWDSTYAFMTPDVSIQMFPNDVLIFILETDTTIRVLGIYRSYIKSQQYNGQEYFELIDKNAFLFLRANKALQIGAEYLIPRGYRITLESNFDCDVLARAIGVETLDKTVSLRFSDNVGSIWHSAFNIDSSLNMDSIKFYGQTDYDFLLNYSELMYNSDEQQYFPLSSACATIPSHSSIPIFYGRFSFDNQYKPTDKNLLSIDANQSYFGRIVNSFNQSQDIFIPHHGKWSDCWGNNVAYENGFTNQNLIDFNDNLGNTISLVAINHGVYQIVNDVITISANLSCQGTFNQGVAGHEFLLYFPLPFKNFIEGGGHGSVRFVDIANHMNIGAIVEPFDENTCLLTAKYSSAINSPTTIDIGFTFSYTIAL